MNASPSLSTVVQTAALWLASTPLERQPQPIVPAICEKFKLTALEACQAIREARLIQGRAM